MGDKKVVVGELWGHQVSRVKGLGLGCKGFASQTTSLFQLRVT